MNITFLAQGSCMRNIIVNEKHEFY